MTGTGREGPAREKAVGGHRVSTHRVQRSDVNGIMDHEYANIVTEYVSMTDAGKYHWEQMVWPRSPISGKQVDKRSSAAESKIRNVLLVHKDPV